VLLALILGLVAQGKRVPIAPLGVGLLVLAVAATTNVSKRREWADDPDAASAERRQRNRAALRVLAWFVGGLTALLVVAALLDWD
jgi:hypothetical protein